MLIVSLDKTSSLIHHRTSRPPHPPPTTLPLVSLSPPRTQTDIIRIMTRLMMMTMTMVMMMTTTVSIASFGKTRSLFYQRRNVHRFRSRPTSTIPHKHLANPHQKEHKENNPYTEDPKQSQHTPLSQKRPSSYGMAHSINLITTMTTATALALVLIGTTPLGQPPLF